MAVTFPCAESLILQIVRVGVMARSHGELS